MDFIFACVIFLTVLISSLMYGLHMLIPLLFGLFCFMIIAVKRGHAAAKVVGMVGRGMSKVFLVLRVFVLIGALTAVWRASGTIQFLVYHGISMINGNYFIVSAFLLTSLVSMLLGSSFGTVGTIGIVLMVIARSGGADVNVTAGAIVAGAYVGDRCAPTASGANLVASLTETDVMDNIRNMMRSAAIPMLLSVIVYVYLSFGSQISSTDSSILERISKSYNIGLITIIPAVLIIILSVLKYRVVVSISISIISAFMVAVFVQNAAITDILRYMAFGYQIETQDQFAKIISGGGITSMIGVMMIVTTASGFSGIFEETGMLDDAINFIEKLSRKLPLFPITLITAVLSSAFGCTQVLSMIMTNQLMKKAYKEHSTKSSLALDIEDSSVVVAPLLPWNIAVSVPLIMLSASPWCIPYAVFLYILPLWRLFNSIRIKNRAFHQL